MSFGIEDRLAIHELLALHGHLVDEGRLADEDLSLLFDAEVRYDVTEVGGQVLEGLAAIRAASLALGERNPVAHLVTNIVVSADADGDHAMARSKGLGVMVSGAVGSVTYTDRLARTPRGWRIVARRISPRRSPLTP